jgi:hypothetical protein
MISQLYVLCIYVHVRVCVCVCVFVCVRACVRACVCVCDDRRLYTTMPFFNYFHLNK